MRRVVLSAIFLILAACEESAPAPAKSANSACEERTFEGDRFVVCDADKGRVELVAAARDEAPIRNFSDLEGRFGARAANVAFAMNAGMFDEDGRPIGLAIVEGRQIRAINRRKGGGNFHLMPNGVFQVRRDGRAEVVTSDKWQPSSDIRLATQSGPMLVIDGKLHPAFDHDGTSLHIRNGVGIGADGAARFVISQDAVSFGKLARFFRDQLKCDNALFFDGAVSALWDPANHRRDVTVPLGPMVVAFKRAESKPGREGPARP
ncbi:MAG TPA: phosphodiester glycosidase family protein [Sphingomicrobium sp.]